MSRYFSQQWKGFVYLLIVGPNQEDHFTDVQGTEDGCSWGHDRIYRNSPRGFEGAEASAPLHWR